MVELSRYHAQALLASRNSFDSERLLPEVRLPLDGVVPAGTILLDNGLSAFEQATSALMLCGFAAGVEVPLSAVSLTVPSDKFLLPTDLELPLSNRSHLGRSFAAVFKMYQQNGQLGHPETLERVLDHLSAAKLIEQRFGYREWSEKALGLAYPRRTAGLSWAEDAFLWATETISWYLEEAERQWTQA